ncbi:MAG TPA: DUF4274 domain-containing protein [Humisphaera sp.]|jgi:hypothetical protein|nr:DUF4274 domain-containing protein [Humisphaera sp.]
MALTPEQSSRVKWLLDGGWGRAESDELPEYWTEFDRVLGQIETPEELHEFVDRWNWDGGTKPIQRALAHPLCDRGTALMVYWRMEPIFFLTPDHDTREKVTAKLWPDAVVHWDMLRELERRLAANQFRTAQVPYDPTNDRGRDRTKQRFRKKKPITLLKNINGKLVKIGEQPRPDDPEIDVRGSLPAIVFEPVKGGASAGT